MKKFTNRFLSAKLILLVSFLFLALAAFAQQATGQITKITDEKRSTVSNSAIETEGKSKSAGGFFDYWQNKENDTGDSLYDRFKNPPNAAKPRVWWHWMNGNITKEGMIN